MLVSCLAKSLALKMEVISLDFLQTTQWNIPEDRSLHVIFLFIFPIMSLSNEIVCFRGEHA